MQEHRTNEDSLRRDVPTFPRTMAFWFGAAATACLAIAWIERKDTESENVAGLLAGAAALFLVAGVFAGAYFVQLRQRVLFQDGTNPWPLRSRPWKSVFRDAGVATLRTLWLPPVLTLLALFGANAWTMEAFVPVAALMFAVMVPFVFVVSVIFFLSAPDESE